MLTPAIDLIPHRPPLVWLDALVDCTESSASGEVCFPADSLAVADGMVLESALVECVAQTVAAAAGQLAARRAAAGPGGPAKGMLVAVTSFKIHRRPLAGEPLRIEVRERKRLGMMLRIGGRVLSGEAIVAEGELTLYA